jgi:hypothetical protein
MAFSNQELDAIYTRTNGRCHICGMKLARRNYGTRGAKAAWHVEHSIPKAAGGTDHRNNLYAACIYCNLQKSDGTSRSARARNGRTRAPLSIKMRGKKRAENAWSGAGIAGVAALLLAPEFVLLGIAAGAFLGHSVEVD